MTRSLDPTAISIPSLGDPFLFSTQFAPINNKIFLIIKFFITTFKYNILVKRQKKVNISFFCAE